MEDPENFSLLLSRGEAGSNAIGAPESPPLTWRALRDLAARTIDDLNAMGIGRDDRVAIVLRNGPEMATTFVCVASCAATAPLNPGYREDEFDFYLGDLQPKALILEGGVSSPARTVATKLSIPVVELHPEPAQGAGSFRLEGPAGNCSRIQPQARPAAASVVRHARRGTAVAGTVP